MDKKANGEADLTQVLNETSKTMHSTQASDIIHDTSDLLDPIDLTVDSTLEFRRSLDRSGKRYQILKLLAEGGFGRIFLARDRILGRKIVIKSLRENLLDKPEVVKKFIAEAKLNAQLDHPAIVPLIGLDSDSVDGLHLAMQLVNGITLKEHLKRYRERYRKRPMNNRKYERSLSSRLESFLHVCDAVEYCHSRHIIHCDLKPENIMLGRHGEVYVMDWGIAAPEGTDRKGNLDGTPSYLAPEAVHDGATTPRTDVFSLGMILNEIVTLRGPVTGADSKEVISKICAGEFEPSTPLTPSQHISSALRAIIEKARALAPESRYQTVRELADDVRHYLFKEEVSAKPDTFLQKIMRFLYRYRYITFWSVIAGLCIFGAMAIYGLAARNCYEEMINHEMIRRVKLQRYTENQAAAINNQLLRLQERLTGFAASLGIELIKPGTTDKDAEIYLLPEFAGENEKRPPQSIDLPFFRHEINVEYPAYMKPDSMSRAELEQMVRPLWMFRRPMLALILGYVRNDDGALRTTSSRMERYLQEGSLLRRINIFFDNGVGMRYPGMYEENQKAGKLQCAYIREKRRQRPYAVLWSPPYSDTDGHPVISCWTPISKPEGIITGYLGFEVCFYQLIKPLFEQNRRERFAVTYYLLDEDNYQIFSSNDLELEHAHREMQTPQRIGGRKFRYPQLLSRIKNGDNSQFSISLDGRNVLVTWSRIPQADWTLLQIVSQEEDNVIDWDLDARNRSRIRGDLQQ